MAAERVAYALLLPAGLLMKAYVITTGVIFALLVAAHIWRVSVESHLARDPAFLTTTIIAALLTIWAGRLAWRLRSQ